MIIKSFLALLKIFDISVDFIYKFSEAFWQNPLEYSCFLPIHIGIYAKLDNKAAWVGKQINPPSHIWNAQKKQKNNSFSTFYFCEERMKHSCLQGSSSPCSHPSSFISPPQIQNWRSRIKWFNEKRWWWQGGYCQSRNKSMATWTSRIKGSVQPDRQSRGCWGRAEVGSEGLIVNAKVINSAGGLCCCSSQTKIEA